MEPTRATIASNLLATLEARLAERPEATFYDLGAELGIPEEHVLRALEGGRIRRATPGDPERLVEDLKSWGRVRVVIRNRAAVAELLTTLGGTTRRGPWWNLHADDFEMHVNLEAVAAVYFIEKPGHKGRATYSVQAFDDAGASIFKVFLTRAADGNFTTETLERWRVTLAAHCS
ncbi:MAG: hypothetical protein KC466_06895 [Myxococcales bacterium]|nr:hypothetical protein [Myxococcales bacterium]